MKCIEDEIPFELPQGWEWCRLGIVFSHNTGKALNKSNTNGKLLSYITTSNVYWDRFELDNLKNMHFTDTELEKCTVKKGDLLVCEGGDIGRAAIWNYDYDICIQNHIHRLRPYANVNIVLYYHIFYYYKLIGMINGKGIGIQGLSSNQLHSIPIPLPPLQEQHRIVIKLKELISFIDTIESDKADLQSTIQLTKSKILDLAIRGKLVPQDPNDEPASVLLERIRTEKEELIKQGKIKQDKKESVIFRGDDNSYYEKIGDAVTCIDEELPFELPGGWTWARLQSICEPITDGTHKTPVYSDSGYIFLSSKNVTSGKIDWDNVMYIPEELHAELYSRLQPKKNDILLAKNGTTGVSAIVDRDCIFDIYVSLALIRIVGYMIIPQYLTCMMGSRFVQDYFNSSLKGIGVPNLHLEHIRTVLIPIAPIHEQKKIAEIVQKYTSILEYIEKSLS